MSGEARRELQSIEGTGPRPDASTSVRAVLGSPGQAAADLGRRLALWLADVAVEAGRTATLERAEPTDRQAPD
ncbi:MAG: hypothetical protein ACHQNA_01160 [Acidimicrobiales bacterium]